MGDKCVQAVLRVDDADDGARSCFRRASSFSASLVADWPTDRQIQTWTVNSLRISAATDTLPRREVEFVLLPAAVALPRPLNRDDPREGVLDNDALSQLP